ncbi:MAG TPA: hypothetical protein VI603_01415 [Saprospiraceae bacterium]|nr:hypothetical protein [Saprospiraceae bacterium]
MHDIEPYYHWRDRYIAAEDERSPFYGRQYSEFTYTHRIYNYLIHPQWDEFGSPTLYMKVIYADYDDGYAMIELIGEWNDCIQNDIESLKRNVADLMMEEGIFRFVLICENVLNFHGSDDCYYEEWYEEVSENHGWIALVNTLRHVESEIRDTGLEHFIDLGGPFNIINWRNTKPKAVVKMIDHLHSRPVRVLP